MRIGIIGTRGIPNYYGGFEQFTEFVAPALTDRGHEVYVYNSSKHPYSEPTWKKVHIIRKYDPENILGTTGQFIYDLNCILDSRKRNFDVILQLGYTSSSIWSFLFPKNASIVTNMDGLEWKRSKYGKSTQQFLKKAEKIAAVKSDYLIADSKGIQAYLLKKYNRKSAFIPYGATLFNSPDVNSLARYELKPYAYNLLIARMEPENNIQMILEAHHRDTNAKELILIGNHSNDYGTYLRNIYENEKIRFLGPIYDMPFLNNLRHFSHLYFHGHSVGGTNPSLLEAMASQALIAAHNNLFNSSVLESDGFYFSCVEDITALLKTHFHKLDHRSYLENNNYKITHYYTWPGIVASLEMYLSTAAHDKVNK
ncbi:MAG: DUF1972 domain-containing protein [Chitinophagaceae bacterium]|nr:DUF1972 domain-containing protein [Chitinophagaceae bacterium]